MEIRDIKKGFTFWATLFLILAFLTSMALLIIFGTAGMTQSGVVTAGIWLLVSVIMPSFVGFFIYQNWRPFWISIVTMIIVGFIVIAVDMSYIIVNNCGHTFYGCDLTLFTPVGTATMILIAISTIIIIVKDWNEKIKQGRSEKQKEQQLQEL
jgi:hypothetical protein